MLDWSELLAATDDMSWDKLLCLLAETVIGSSWMLWQALVRGPTEQDKMLMSNQMLSRTRAYSSVDKSIGKARLPRTSATQRLLKSQSPFGPSLTD